MSNIQKKSISFSPRSFPVWQEFSESDELGLRKMRSHRARDSGQFSQEKPNRGPATRENIAIGNLDMRLLIAKIESMTERSAEILLAAIKEFIHSGEPISSGDLYGRYDFGIKPAMIRMELLDLTDLGYLEQPYHSAGRVPTDRGYKFFAQEMLKEAPADSRSEMWEAMLAKHNWNDFLENFSKTMGMAGVLVDETLRDIHRAGLRYLFENLDPAEDQGELAQVVEDFEDIGSHLPKALNMFGEDFCEVLVGRNPLTASDHLSVMAADYDVGGRKIFFFAIGPKRMDYEKTAKALKGLKTKSKVKVQKSPPRLSSKSISGVGRIKEGKRVVKK